MTSAPLRSLRELGAFAWNKVTLRELGAFAWNKVSSTSNSKTQRKTEILFLPEVSPSFDLHSISANDFLSDVVQPFLPIPDPLPWASNRCYNNRVRLYSRNHNCNLDFLLIERPIPPINKNPSHADSHFQRLYGIVLCVLKNHKGSGNSCIMRINYIRCKTLIINLTLVWTDVAPWMVFLDTASILVGIWKCF